MWLHEKYLETWTRKRRYIRLREYLLLLVFVTPKWHAASVSSLFQKDRQWMCRVSIPESWGLVISLSVSFSPHPTTTSHTPEVNIRYTVGSLKDFWMFSVFNRALKSSCISLLGSRRSNILF